MRNTVRFENIFLRMPVFNGLAAETQQAIAGSASHRHYDGGQVIYLEGEPAETIYVLEKGWVKATRMTREGREQAMKFLQPFEIFGDIAALTGRPYPGTVAALEPVDVWAIPAKRVLKLIESHSDLALAVIRHMGERVFHYIDLVEDLSLRSVEARLANNLLQYAELQDGRLIVQRHDWATFDQMAVRLGTVRDVLSRTLKTLEAADIIRVEKQYILVLDPKALAERANR